MSKETTYQKVEKKVEDIRNKLTPFWTLSTLVKEQAPISEIDKIIHKQAANAELQKPCIIKDLEDILEILKSAQKDEEK